MIMTALITLELHNTETMKVIAMIGLMRWTWMKKSIYINSKYQVMRIYKKIHHSGIRSILLLNLITAKSFQHRASCKIVMVYLLILQFKSKLIKEILTIYNILQRIRHMMLQLYKHMMKIKIHTGIVQTIYLKFVFNTNGLIALLKIILLKFTQSILIQ